MTNMTNLTKYTNKALLQLLKFNNAFVKMLATKDNEKVMNFINENFILSDEQKQFIKEYLKSQPKPNIIN